MKLVRIAWILQLIFLKFEKSENLELLPDIKTEIKSQAQLQCSSLNDVTNNISWVPGEFPEGSSPCVIRCQTSAPILDKVRIMDVTDGTRCGVNDICAKGKCEPLGCIEESSKVCGKCGFLCHLVTGIYVFNKNKIQGQDHVITIPKNSQFVSLSGSGVGHIGLKINQSSELLKLNDFDNNHITSFNYDVTYGYNGKLKFVIKGPIASDIEVMAVDKSELRKYLRYEFYRPLTATWKHNTAEVTCSSTCGGGLMFIRPICVDVSSNEVVEDQVCEAQGLIPPSPQVHRCNDIKCPASSTVFKRIEPSFEFYQRHLWIEDPWTLCSAECSGGYQIRTISCAKETLNGEYLPSDEKLCVGIQAPETWRKCNEHLCPVWVAQPWNKCLESKGLGYQNRIVQCQTPEGAPAYDCDVTTKPINVRSCALKRIVRHHNYLAQHGNTVTSISPEPSWVSGNWGGCSTTCGRGITVREVRCKKVVLETGTIQDLDDVICDGDKPVTSQACSVGLCPDNDVTRVNYDVAYDDYYVTDEEEVDKYEFLESSEFGWRFGNFSSCVPSCGNGSRTSIPLCRHKATNALASSDHCDVIARPASRVEKCFGGPCQFGPITQNRTRWDLTPYRDCNVTCGRGLQVRSVVCRQMPEGEDYSNSSRRVNGRRMPDVMCPAPKPTDKMICSQVECPPKWVPQLWGKCSRPCGRGFQSRKLRCFQKLGSGETVEVPSHFCPKETPMTRSPCNVRNCPARYVTKKWSECNVTCGKGTQTRFSHCVQVLAGKYKPQKVSRVRCHQLMRPTSQKSCYLGKCPPLIHSSDDVFIQKRRQRKIQLQVGNNAYIHPRTTIIVKCRVERFRKDLIQWKRNDQPISDERVSVMPDGSLRLLHSQSSDSGTYTCLAGSSRANFYLTVTNNTSRANIPEPSMSIPDSPLQNNFPPVGAHQVIGPNSRLPTSRSSLQTRKVVSMAPRPEPIPRFDPYEISYTEQRPVFITKQEDYDDINNYIPRFENNNQDETEKSQLVHSEGYEDLIDQVNSIGGIPEEIDIHSPSDSDIHNLLGILNGNSLKTTTSSDLRPRITPHPTLAPLQLGRVVDVYVGGSLIVAEADRITILCEAKGSPPPTYAWFRDDVRLPENRRQFVLQDGSLRLLYPQTTDSGNYMCVASNLHGNDSQVTSLSVAQAPRILATTAVLENFTSDHVVATVGGKIRAKLGSKVTIQCPTEGFPDPYVLWHKDSTGLRQNSKLLPDNSIEIFPTTEADQGLFGCEASNPAGTYYQASSLVLIEPPRVSEELNVVPNIEGVIGLPELLMTGLDIENYKVKVNSSVMMGCPVTGFPEPDIKWYFNNELLTMLENAPDYQLLLNNKVLQLANADPETKGRYSCIATNEGGTLNTSLDLGLIVYSYQYGEMRECSSLCGDSGTQYRNLICLEDGAKEVDEWYCIGVNKPFVIIQPCNRVDCPPRYMPGPWGQCSVTCGNGTRTRSTSCSILMSDGSVREVAAEECQDSILTKVEKCHEQSCPWWKLGTWQKCTRRCAGRGVGVKTRKAFCVSGNGSRIEPRTSCQHLPRPKRRSYCPNRRCEPVWRASKWSVCSNSCGNSGIRTRILNCVYRGRRRQSAGNQCNARRRPPVSMPCNRSSCANKSATVTPARTQRLACASRSRCILIRQRKLCRFYKKQCCKICR